MVSEAGYLVAPHKNKYGRDYPPSADDLCILSRREELILSSPQPRQLSLFWKILLSTSIAITLLLALAGWFARDETQSVLLRNLQSELQSRFGAYESLWQSRATTLRSVSLVLSGMPDVRAAFQTNDRATIKDTAAEVWSKVSQSNALFLVTDPRGEVIASLGGGEVLGDDIDAVLHRRFAFSRANGRLCTGARAAVRTRRDSRLRADTGCAWTSERPRRRLSYRRNPSRAVSRNRPLAAILCLSPMATRWLRPCPPLRAPVSPNSTIVIRTSSVSIWRTGNLQFWEALCATSKAPSGGRSADRAYLRLDTPRHGCAAAETGAGLGGGHSWRAVCWSGFLAHRILKADPATR